MGCVHERAAASSGHVTTIHLEGMRLSLWCNCFCKLGLLREAAALLHWAFLTAYISCHVVQEQARYALLGTSVLLRENCQFDQFPGEVQGVFEACVMPFFTQIRDAGLITDDSLRELFQVRTESPPMGCIVTGR